ncbi:MAG TPA: universal stress protein [Bacteroidetes bacterium]|nr:universal stress protein [Bacteroidota bacterium]
MKKIIVPTDFSAHSGHAIPYAQKFAKSMGAEIEVVHVWYPDMNVDDPVDFMQTKLEELQKKRLHSFLKENGLPISAGKLLPGFPGATLVGLSEDEDVGMIIMGKQGQANTLKKIFGTVSSAVAKDAKCPVLLVPHGAKWNGKFKNIMVAAGVEATDEKSLGRILDITRAFGANVHFVHIKKSPEDMEGLLVEDKILDKLINDDTLGYTFNLVDIPYKNVIEGLNLYAEENNVDMAIMISRHRKWWKDMFHKSKIKMAALTLELPLLALHLDDH